MILIYEAQISSKRDGHAKLIWNGHSNRPGWGKGGALYSMRSCSCFHSSFQCERPLLPFAFNARHFCRSNRVGEISGEQNCQRASFCLQNANQWCTCYRLRGKERVLHGYSMVSLQESEHGLHPWKCTERWSNIRLAGKGFRNAQSHPVFLVQA